MSKLLIYIGEHERFDLQETIAAITSIEGVTNARQGAFIGAVFDCNFSYRGRTTVVRLSDSLKTVTAEGLGDESMEFAVRLQKALPTPMRVIDLDYSFDVALSDFSTGDELLLATEE
jgi:hypothetical protein